MKARTRRALTIGPAGVVGGFFTKVRDLLGFQRDGTDASSRIDDLEHSPGIAQLTPQNPTLMQLKDQLKLLHQQNVELRLVNIYSSREDVVPASSGTLDFSDLNVDLADTGKTHLTFMEAPAGSRLHMVFASSVLTVGRNASTLIESAPPPGAAVGELLATPVATKVATPPPVATPPVAETSAPAQAPAEDPSTMVESSPPYAPRPAPGGYGPAGGAPAYPAAAYANRGYPRNYPNQWGQRPRPGWGGGRYYGGRQPAPENRRRW